MFAYRGVATKDFVADIWTSQDVLIIVLSGISFLTFQIPTRSIARTAFLCKALADFVPQCSQVVAEVAGFASGGPPTADDAFSPSILATLLPASPA
jgi:hypothetical protein